MIDCTEYINFVRASLETEEYIVVDTMNKMALESKTISVDTYRKAAHLIADAFLAHI